MHRPSPALVVAVAALVVAVVGTAMAAPSAIKSVLNGKEKKQTTKIAKKVVADAAAGLSVGNAANAANAANAGNAALLDTIDSTGFHRYGASIPSGVTLTGAFGGIGHNDGTGASGGFYNDSVSFPVPAPDGLTDAEVNFDDDTAATIAGDDTAACTGTPTNPTAPAGNVCLYVTNTPAGTAGTADGTALPNTNAGGGSRFGFGINLTGNPTTAEIYGVWAYTAP